MDSWFKHVKIDILMVAKTFYKKKIVELNAEDNNCPHIVRQTLKCCNLSSDFRVNDYSFHKKEMSCGRMSEQK